MQPGNIGNRGFTLLEIIVVVMIIGILAAIVAPKFIGRADDAKVTAAKVQIDILKAALKFYRLDNHSYPSTDQGLEALISRPSLGKEPKNYREGGYLDTRKLPLDPWGEPYIYISPASDGDFEIISLGADGLEGGDGTDADISSSDL